MPFSDRMRRLLWAGRKLAAMRRAVEQAELPLEAPVTDDETLIQREQLEIAEVIDQAVAMLERGFTEAAKAALRVRVEKLSPSARFTAKVLTKVRMDTRSTNQRQHTQPNRRP